MKSTEKEIQKLIMEYLTLKGIFHYRQNGGAIKTRGHMYKFTSINGIPDIVAIKDGIYYGIEVKDVKGRQNDAQIEFEKLLNAAGGVYFVARSLDDVIDILK